MVSYQLGLLLPNSMLFPEDLVAGTHRELLRHIRDEGQDVCVCGQVRI